MNLCKNEIRIPEVCYCLLYFLPVKVLLGLWRNDLVSLKGACPNCGEEVSTDRYYLVFFSFSALRI